VALVILNRDGVINLLGEGPVCSVEEWLPVTGSLDAIARLTQRGHRIVVTTTQPGIGTGALSVEALNRIHAAMLERLAGHGGVVDAIFYCPHAPDAQCDCAKPKPGLLKKVSQRARKSLDGVPVVGHNQIDVDAAVAAGARPVLVRTGDADDACIEAATADANIDVFDDLAGFADHFLIR
jgi:D-glycero-D-manno-heptose 1,7-bisphosphate phosphatase